MGTPQPIGGSIDNLQAINSRLVWVLNEDRKYSYKGTWRSVKVEIPADEKKIPKRFEDGGNLFPFMEACHFVRDLVEAQDYVMDQMGRPQPVFRNKSLKEVELTVEERLKLTGETPSDLKKQVLIAEKAAKRSIKTANDKVRNKIAMTDEEAPEA